MLHFFTTEMLFQTLSVCLIFNTISGIPKFSWKKRNKLINNSSRTGMRRIFSSMTLCVGLIPNGFSFVWMCANSCEFLWGQRTNGLLTICPLWINVCPFVWICVNCFVGSEPMICQWRTYFKPMVFHFCEFAWIA